MISGFYLRVKRGNSFHSLDITELTNEELVTAMNNKDKAVLISWIAALTGIIKDIRPMHEQLERD